MTEKIGKYEIREEIGRGGMGVVYRAYDSQIDREVAIKIISDRALEIPEIKARFLREARTAGKLSHENITTVFDLGESEGKTFIVMEFLHGQDLRLIIDNKDPLTLRQKLEYAKQICRGLSYAHANGVIHRDIKPENVKILGDGRAKIIDFGIAKPVTNVITPSDSDPQNALTQAGVRIGTPWYMSPEQVRGHQVDRRSDIFSFGVLLYELLTYRKPFDGDDTTVMYKIVHVEPESINIQESNLNDHLQAVLLKCLAKDVNARYDDCSEVLEALALIPDNEDRERRVKALLAESRVLKDQKRFGDAIKKYNEILKIDPNHDEANVNIKKLVDRERDSATIKILTGRIIGEIVLHYEIIERLGSGGMGVVYKAEDLSLKRIVALKFLNPDLTRDESAKKRFLKEAQTASALDHINIGAIHEVNETEEGLMFISMAYYEGDNLSERLGKGRIGDPDCLDLAIQIARGLEDAHKHGITHRDIKPANILLTKDGIAKVVDFGLAKLAGTTKITKTGTTMGTLPYMSPEQVKGLELDHRSDIWSFGVMLYELATGELPFKGAYEVAVLNAIVNENPAPLSSLRPDLPPGLEEVIVRAMKKSLGERYSSMTEVLIDLGRVRENIFRERDRSKEVSRLLDTGKNLLNKKQYSDAMVKFEAALKLDPGSKEANDGLQLARRGSEVRHQVEKHLATAKKLFGVGKYDEAIAECEAVLSNDPDVQEAVELASKCRRNQVEGQEVQRYVKSGEKYLDAGRFGEALSEFSAALRIDPASKPVQELIELCKRKQAGVDDLKRELSDARALMGRGNYAEAVSMVESLLARDPKNKEVIELANQGKARLAELQRVEKLLNDGKKFAAGGKYNESLSAFKEALALKPDHKEAYSLMETVQEKIRQAETIAKLLVDAEFFLKRNKAEEAVKAFGEVLRIDPGNKDAARGLKKAEGKIEARNVGTVIADKPVLPAQSRKPILVMLTVFLIAVAGFLVWKYLNAPVDKATVKVDSGPADVAKQTMLAQKSRAENAGAETWAKESYTLGRQKESEGESAYATGKYDDARGAYTDAKVYYNNSAEEADSTKNSASLKVLRENTLKANQAMTTDKSAAEKVGAKTKAKDVYANALERERAGDESFNKGGREDLLAAQSAYLDARDGYNKARLLVMTPIPVNLEPGASSALSGMNASKAAVPGGEKEKNANANFKKAEELESAAQKSYQAKDFASARNTSNEAKGLYDAAAKEIDVAMKGTAAIETKLRKQVDAARGSMETVKARIDKDNYADAKYQSAVSIEGEGKKAEDVLDFERATDRYKTAENRYGDVLEYQVAQRGIQTVIDRVKAALEGSDLQKLAALLRFTPSDIDTWSSFFASTKNISVSTERWKPTVSGNNATVEVPVRLSYYNNKNEKATQNLSMAWELGVSSGEWTILSSKLRYK